MSSCRMSSRLKRNRNLSKNGQIIWVTVTMFAFWDLGSLLSRSRCLLIWTMILRSLEFRLSSIGLFFLSKFYDIDKWLPWSIAKGQTNAVGKQFNQPPSETLNNCVISGRECRAIPLDRERVRCAQMKLEILFCKHSGPSADHIVIQVGGCIPCSCCTKVQILVNFYFQLGYKHQTNIAGKAENLSIMFIKICRLNRMLRE